MRRGQELGLGLRLGLGQNERSVLVGVTLLDYYDAFKLKLLKAYHQLRIGNPLDSNNHVGPLIDKEAVKMYLRERS